MFPVSKALFTDSLIPDYRDSPVVVVDFIEWGIALINRVFAFLEPSRGKETLRFVESERIKRHRSIDASKGDAEDAEEWWGIIKID